MQKSQYFGPTKSHFFADSAGNKRGIVQGEKLSAQLCWAFELHETEKTKTGRLQ